MGMRARVCENVSARARRHMALQSKNIGIPPPLSQERERERALGESGSTGVRSRQDEVADEGSERRTGQDDAGTSGVCEEARMRRGQ